MPGRFNLQNALNPAPERQSRLRQNCLRRSKACWQRVDRFSAFCRTSRTECCAVASDVPWVEREGWCSVMVEVEKGSAAETLAFFHGLLDAHFRAIQQRRQKLGTPSPVFALEHGLDANDRKLLQDAVVAAHAEGIITRASSRWWLPLVAHAAEVGYIYDGVEFWPIYAKATPGWIDSEYERDRVRAWFYKFSTEYGGAIPRGAWATTFRKIAWPITHAVLPRYLQVQLARMLFDYRTAWPSLLDYPDELGVRLHSWSRSYGERLEKFCQNTALLGHVAVALLLARQDTPSPYIESTTLDRLVESLNSERQSRRWLHDARRSASIVRTRNFKASSGDGGAAAGSAERRSPALTDPKLQLRELDGVWHAYAVLPDLKPLQHRLDVVYEEMRRARASVAGSKEIIRSGALLYALAPVELSTWPSPREPFLQLTSASQKVNLLIADQCRMTNGPWWIFRCKQGQPAPEVKGKLLRPGRRYVILGASDLGPPDVAWCEHVETAVNGAATYSLNVPMAISDEEFKALVAAGLSVVSNLSIQPVGVTASSWDGEGAAEWLAGEPILVRIHAEHSPQKCRLTINGDPYYIDWPSGETDLFLSLDGLATGTHDVVVSLGDFERDARQVGGTLTVSIVDPQAPAEGLSAGEGIRVRTSPAQPTLPELWDGRAVIEVDGPEATRADLLITLRNGDTKPLGDTLNQSLKLPVSGDDWRRVFSKLRENNELSRHYDEADVVELTISKAGVGFASITCERGFRGLRWVLNKNRRSGYRARLIDRTDGESVSVDFYPMDRPLSATTHAPEQEFTGPPRGGLLWASSGDQVAGQIIPPDPNELLRIGPTTPSVPARPKSLNEVRSLIHHHRRWNAADLPAHPFGLRDRVRVLQTLTTALTVMLAPGRWAHFERQIANLAPEDVDLDHALDLVGDTMQQRATAKAIATRLWEWNTAEALIAGFSEVIYDLATSSRMKDARTGSRCLLLLASSPGELADWDQDELNHYLRCVLTDPVLVRAARLAVLGTIEEIPGGVG